MTFPEKNTGTIKEQPCLRETALKITPIESTLMTVKIAIQKIKTDLQSTHSRDLVIPTAEDQEFHFKKGLIGMSVIKANFQLLRVLF